MLQKESDRFRGHLIRLGALALVLGIVPAVIGGFELAVTAEFAIATHVAMLMYGVLLLCLGLSWDELQGEPGRPANEGPDHRAFWSLVAAGFLLFTTGTFAAVKGVGGLTLSAFDADATGTRLVEWVVRFATAWAGLCLLRGLWLIAKQLLPQNERRQEQPDRGSVGFLLGGGLLLFAAGAFAAVKGIGGWTLSLLDANETGTRLVEWAVRIGVTVAGLLLMRGLRPTAMQVWAAASGLLADEEPTPAARRPKVGFAEGSSVPDPAAAVTGIGLWRFTVGLAGRGGGSEQAAQEKVASALQGMRGGEVSVHGAAETVASAPRTGTRAGRWLRALFIAARGGETAPIQTQLFRWGFLLVGIGVLSATLQGALGIHGLSVAGHATIGITGLIFMSMGHVWVRLEQNLKNRVDEADPTEVAKEERHRTETPRVVLGMMRDGAVLNIIAVVLAAILGLHDDPLAVVSAGWTAEFSQLVDSVDRLGPFVVKSIAVLALVANSFGIVVFAHGMYDRADRPKHTTMNRRLSDRLVRYGTLALVVGFLTAWLPELSRLPRVAVGTYATLLIIGPMFICFGLVWEWTEDQRAQIRLSPRRQRLVVSALSIGALGIVVAGMVLALLGVGGNTLTISAAGALGSERAELLAKIFVDTAIFTVGAAMIMFWLSLSPPTRTRFHRVVWAASLATVAMILQATFYHATVNARLTGSYPIRLPDYRYGTDVDEWAVDHAWDSRNSRERAQNWSPADWRWFYHTSQGGAFEVPIPYAWLMALEQPIVHTWPPWRVDSLMAPDYLQGFGFLPNVESEYDPDDLSIDQGYIARFLGGVGEPDEREAVDGNPSRLPVGFARTDNWVDQSTGDMVDVMGFTCAACHTSQLDYADSLGNVVRVRVEGGPANIDLGRFRRAVSVSLGLTRLLPGRFDRFARNLRIESPEGRTALRQELDRLVDRIAAVRTLQDSLGVYPTEEGFGRLDAMGRIFNFVFGTDIDDPGNLGVANAPVNFPYLWDAARFEWVQYNASFTQPMIRNAGQSMGVFASVDLRGAGKPVAIEDDPELFTSSIDVANIHEMELLLGGCTLRARNRPTNLESGCPVPFEGLKSPIWPEVFPRYDAAAERAGEALYLEHCAHCHLPPPDRLAQDPDAWTTRPDGNSFLSLRTLPLDIIGTDPWAARNFATRQVRLGELGERMGIGPDTMLVNAADALPMLVENVLRDRYEAFGVGENLQPILEGHREPRKQIILGYRARPLNGVWATAPFLHNGSVPTLYQLLSPQAERPDTFHLGSRMFDPHSVGFEYKKHDAGYFEFDTSLPGNSNLGHSFEGTEDGRRGRAGVIGRELTDQERYQIIEYLKTLGPLPVRPAAGGGDG